GQPVISYTLYALLVIGGINTVISAGYYLKVLKVMVLEKTVEEIEGGVSKELPMPVGAAFYSTLLAALIVVLGILWDPLVRASDKGVEAFEKPRPAPVAAVRPPVGEPVP